MVDWFAGLYTGWQSGFVNLGAFPFGDFFAGVIWNALALFLPLLVITGIALWAVNLAFPRGK